MWCINLNFLDFDQVPSPSTYCINLYITRNNRNNDIMDDIVEENDVDET